MNKIILLALAVALAAPFAAVADQNILGVPDSNCQSPSDWRLHDYSGAAGGGAVAVQNGATTFCQGTSFWDGDAEFGTGGARLVAYSGDGATHGGLACYDTVGHHPGYGGTVTVLDASGLDVTFAVASDITNPSSPVPPGVVDCGDGIIEPCEGPKPLPAAGPTCTEGDVYQRCLNACLLGFDPGADGAYHVFVESTGATGASLGHIHL